MITDLRMDNFGGFRAFLELAPGLGVDGRTVKWQFVGPITLGLTLARAGVPVDIAFRQAVTTVRSHVSALGTALRAALPASEQLVVIDEPLMVDLMAADFPLPPDAAADLLSTAMVASSGATKRVTRVRRLKSPGPSSSISNRARRGRIGVCAGLGRYSLVLFHT